MKTSEFIEKVEKLEFVSEVEETESGNINFFEECLRLKNRWGKMISTVSLESEFLIDNRFNAYKALNFNERKKLFDLLTEYAATPIAERRDKTIEDKAKEYIQSYITDDLSFESARDFLECCSLYVTDNRYFQGRYMHTEEELAEYAAIYDWYHEHSTEFIRMWLEVSEDE